MHDLTPEKIATLPKERGFRLRGLEMTRIEVFVDAAFAFAVTMLVISFDEIPRTFDELRFMFVFLGIGFALLCLVFLLLYGHALRQRKRLLLMVWSPAVHIVRARGRK